jgi:hypothetical protein
MKQDWKKSEKRFYLPAGKPELVKIPPFGFFTINGKGNPNDPIFGEYISALYGASYAVKMSPKKGIAPAGYYEYSVYPLEGIWDLTDEGKQSFNGTIDKNQLVFKLMIRQPDFVDAAYAELILEESRKKKGKGLLQQVNFEIIEEGECVQMLHNGSFDSEPDSFRQMEMFTKEQSLVRSSMTHREIYLSDARKVSADKLKTVLRFKVRSEK